MLRFRVGERRWALPLEVVREVLESPALLPVPRCRAGVAGVMLRDGMVVPVYDLQHGGAPPAHVLVFDWADLRNAIRVSDPDAKPVLGEESGGEMGPPCRGVLKFQDGSAERVDLPSLYRMLEIPT
jgi:chemotaxis signal transduction protein